MIVFESIYPIQLNTELNWNPKLEESSNKAFSKTTITINKDFIMVDSTDESDLIFHIIGEGEGKYNKIEVLLSDLKKFYDQICGLFNFISDNNPNYIIAI